MTAVSMHEGLQPRRRLPVRQRFSLAAEIVSGYLNARKRLAREGLPAALAAARSGVPAVKQESGAAADTRYAAYRLGQLVERILHFFPDARCLIRSIVLVGMLARRGVASTLVIGVSPAPDFRAHAWVELDGNALLPAYKTEYSRLTEL